MAELFSGPWRSTLTAATILGQSKTAHQAEIDAACEAIDFLRFNVEYMARIYAEQPASGPGVWTHFDYRPLEGFVLAISLFNFTATGLNLSSAPALMGNTVHGAGPPIGEAALASPDLAGIHFTGSTATFQHLWRSVGNRIDTYRTYPRLVGETGGKDFIVAHRSADFAALAAGPSSTRGRSARPRRGCTSRRTSGRSCESGSWLRPSRSPWAIRPISATSWAR